MFGGFLEGGGIAGLVFPGLIHQNDDDGEGKSGGERKGFSLLSPAAAERYSVIE